MSPGLREGKGCCPLGPVPGPGLHCALGPYCGICIEDSLLGLVLGRCLLTPVELSSPCLPPFPVPVPAIHSPVLCVTSSLPMFVSSLCLYVFVLSLFFFLF